MAAIGAGLRRTTSLPSEQAGGRLAVETSPRLAGLAVADSPATFTQQEVLDRLGLAGDEFAREASLPAAAWSAATWSSATGSSGTRCRDAAPASRISCCATRFEAVDELDIDPRRIGTVLSASLYSTGCPALAHRLVDHYQLDPATDKYHLVGVGCASAVPLLRLAAQALSAAPARQALVVAADSMSSILMRAGQRDPKAKTVGSAIFGDGCAAAVLSREEGGRRARDRRLRGPPDRRHAARRQPRARARRQLPAPGPRAARARGRRARGARRPLPAAQQPRRAAIDHWIVHPGGRRIIDSVQDRARAER